MKILTLVFIIFMSNIAFCDERPIPNVTTGGNPHKKNVPWPTTKPKNFYNKAQKTFYHRAYIRHYQSCAAHRYGVYSYR